MLKKIFDYFLFTSIYIALCAVIMVYQTNNLLHLAQNHNFYFFAFFSTIASYNFHWMLTPYFFSSKERINWVHENRNLQIILFLAGAAGSIVYFIPLWQYWFWIGGVAALNFLYSAPKLPFHLFQKLKQFAIGKTIFLAVVWTYVTTTLPVIVDKSGFTMDTWIFTFYRFFLIYAICILFDYRDREEDKEAGIISLVTWLNDKWTNIIFFFSIAIAVILPLILFSFKWNLWVIIFLILPVLIVSGLYSYAKKNHSDYLYYFVLDGLMMFSGLFTFLF